MALKQLTLDSLGEFNGGQVGVAFAHHLRRVIEDCQDRPGVTSSRTVTVKLSVTPELLQEGVAVDAGITADVKSSIPSHSGSAVMVKIGTEGRALFNDLSEDNPNQMTIDQ